VGEVFKRYKGARFLGYSLRWYEGGRRRVLASRQPTYAEARRMLQAIEGRIARGLAGLDEPEGGRAAAPTVAQLIEQWLREYSRPRMKDPAVYKMHARSSLKRVLPALGRRPADAVTPLEVAKLRDALGGRYAAASVRLTLAFLRTAYAWAIKQKLVATNPCREVESPRPRTLLEFLSPEEAPNLLAYAEAHAPELHPMLATALYTGMRKGELFGLRWRDLDLERRCLDIQRSYRGLPKGGKPRHLRLPAELVPVLGAWRSRCPPTREGLVFPIVRRGVVNMGRCSDMLGLPELLSAAGCARLERPWHALRHTFASHYVMAGGNLLALQQILGHADIKHTLIYAHLASDYLGAEMDRVSFGKRRLG
jgi:integrase